jgi:DNA-binding transcriptional MerR regulator
MAIRVPEQRGILVKRICEMNLDKIEEAQAEGLTSRQILDIFEVHGISLSEATLRKYVQLGLLPRSIRVGSKGKHQGSKGMYPVRVVRQILLIKQMMAQDYTIEQIQKEFLFLRGDLEQLESTLGGILKTLDDAVSDITISGMAREVNAARSVGRDLIVRLRTLESRVLAERRQARMGSFAQEVSAVG